MGTVRGRRRGIGATDTPRYRLRLCWAKAGVSRGGAPSSSEAGAPALAAERKLAIESGGRSDSLDAHALQVAWRRAARVGLVLALSRMDEE